MESLIIIIMGVSGCGKSTIAAKSADSIGAYFKDADELHPRSNIDKMASGKALTDQDREPWLLRVVDHCHERSRQHKILVVACSALKKKYRNTLTLAGKVVFVHLVGSFELISARMQARDNHFMPEALLRSQFRDLEVPTSEETVISINIESDIDTVVKEVVDGIKSHALYRPVAEGG